MTFCHVSGTACRAWAPVREERPPTRAPATGERSRAGSPRASGPQGRLEDVQKVLTRAKGWSPDRYRSPDVRPASAVLSAPCGSVRRMTPDGEVQTSGEPTQWTIHGERVVDDTRRMKVSIASVQLPDGVEFEQYVFRMPPAAMAVAVDDQDRVLMIWRHRFIMDRWTWELPGGYVDPGEDPAQTATRELREEAGCVAGSVKLLASFQPLAGSADFENFVYLAEDLSSSGEPVDINEAARIEWVPLANVRDKLAKGEIIGAGAQIGLLHAARLRGY